MKGKMAKIQTREKINDFFLDIADKTPEQTRKIKEIAMHYNIKLGERRKKFCRKCYAIFNPSNTEVRIKNKMRVIKCLKCGYGSRWKIKTS